MRSGHRDGNGAQAMEDAVRMFVVGSFVAACSAKVERLPRPGETLRGSHFVLDPGGKGFNVALGLRRLGAAVDGRFAIGGDIFAEFAARAFPAHGLDPGMLVRVAGPTGAGIGFIDSAGENCIAVTPGANALLSAAHIAAAAGPIARAQAVLAQFETADEPIAAAFGLARRAGVTTMLNPSPMRAIRDAILDTTDMMILNRAEAAALAEALGVAEDADRRALAQRLFARGLRTLIVTLGAEGVVALTTAGEIVRQPAFPVSVVDTIGAGDAFLAAFAAAWVEGGGLASALRHGAAAGAITAARLGVAEALPDRAAVQAMLDALAPS